MIRENNKSNADPGSLSLLTLREASDLLGCHPNTLRKWDIDGILKAVRVGTRNDRRYRRSDIERFVGKSSYVKDNEEVKDVSAVRKGYFKEFASLLAERAELKADSVFVDVPCGTGEMTRALADSGFGEKYYLIDINDKMIAAAHRNAPRGSIFMTGDAADIAGLVREKVDAVFCLNGFHIYVDRKQDFLKGCNKILKPGGVLIFDVSTKGIGDKKTKEFLSVELREFNELARKAGIACNRPTWPDEELIDSYRQMVVKEGFSVEKTISVDTWMPIKKPIEETLKIPGRLRAWLPGISDAQRAKIYKMANDIAKKQTGIETIKHNRIFFIAVKK